MISYNISVHINIYIHIVDAETPIHNFSTAGLQEPSQLRKMEAQEAQDGSTSEI
jgi:hypothetical protein